MAVSIATITPGRGRAGDTVTLAGAGFGPAGTNGVTFDGFPASGALVEVVDSETLRAVVPAGIAVNRPVLVQVYNGVDSTTANWWWFSKLGTAALLAGDRLPGKIPGDQEATGSQPSNVFLAEARDFERVANRLELAPLDLLLADGDLLMVSSSGGPRQVSPGADGTVLTRSPATGGEFRARELAVMNWGLQVAAGTTTEVLMIANGLAKEAGAGETGHPAFLAQRLALLTIFIAPSSSGTSSRINRVRVLVDDVEAFDSQDLTPASSQPNENRGDVWTVAPWLQLSADDKIEVAITKSNATNTLDVLAAGVLL